MIRIDIPATSANLGPGFDCLGMALNLYNVIEVQKSDRLQIEILGEGQKSIPKNERNLTYRSYAKALEEMGKEPMPLRLRQINRIPSTRGLGSSATAVVGGILVANAMAGANWSKERILELATRIEGHPDNVAPAIYGGFTVAMENGEGVQCISFPIPREMVPVALIPQFELSTKKARGVLPKSVPHRDASKNIAHASMLVACMARRDLRRMEGIFCDWMHQPYRSPLIPGFDEMRSQCEQAGAMGAFLSGAGPTLLAIVRRAQATEFVQKMTEYIRETGMDWKIKRLKGDNVGAKVKHL